MVGYSNTELIPGSRCNFAYKLGCGHTMVDDCSVNSLNRQCFRNGGTWELGVIDPSSRVARLGGFK